MRRARDAGVTLTEVLVALAIVGTMAGAALLGLGALGRGPSGEAEAMRLASHKLPISTKFVIKEGLEHGHQ